MGDKPDKLALKNKLYSDQVKILEEIDKSTDEAVKKQLHEKLDLVNSYILICIRRKKF